MTIPSSPGAIASTSAFRATQVSGGQRAAGGATGSLGPHSAAVAPPGAHAPSSQTAPAEPAQRSSSTKLSDRTACAASTQDPRVKALLSGQARSNSFTFTLTRQFQKNNSRLESSDDRFHEAMKLGFQLGGSDISPSNCVAALKAMKQAGLTPAESTAALAQAMELPDQQGDKKLEMTQMLLRSAKAAFTEKLPFQLPGLTRLQRHSQMMEGREEKHQYQQEVALHSAAKGVAIALGMKKELELTTGQMRGFASLVYQTLDKKPQGKDENSTLVALSFMADDGSLDGETGYEKLPATLAEYRDKLIEETVTKAEPGIQTASEKDLGIPVFDFDDQDNALEPEAAKRPADAVVSEPARELRIQDYEVLPSAAKTNVSNASPGLPPDAPAAHPPALPPTPMPTSTPAMPPGIPSPQFTRD